MSICSSFFPACQPYWVYHLIYSTEGWIRALTSRWLITRGENRNKSAQVLYYPLMVLKTHLDGRHQDLPCFVFAASSTFSHWTYCFQYKNMSFGNNRSWLVNLNNRLYSTAIIPSYRSSARLLTGLFCLSLTALAACFLTEQLWTVVYSYWSKYFYSPRFASTHYQYWTTTRFCAYLFFFCFF